MLIHGLSFCFSHQCMLTLRNKTYISWCPDIHQLRVMHRIMLKRMSVYVFMLLLCHQCCLLLYIVRFPHIFHTHFSCAGKWDNIQNPYKAQSWLALEARVGSSWGIITWSHCCSDPELLTNFLLLGIKSGFNFTPVYQPDCSSDLWWGPPLLGVSASLHVCWLLQWEIK